MVKIGGSSSRANIERNLGNNRAVVGKGVNLEKSNSRSGFAVDNLPGAGGGTAVLGQGGGMNINDFVGGNINHVLGKIRRAVGNHQTKVRVEIGDG